MNIANKKIIIDANFPSETRVVLLGQNNAVEEIKYNLSAKRQNKGNIYLAKITRIEPSLHAIFIEYGKEKSGFLPFVEIHPSYYNIKGLNSKAFLKDWDKIQPPQITKEDLNEKHIELEAQGEDIKDEIDIEKIKEFEDDKIDTELELEVAENEIEHIELEARAKDNSSKNSPKIQDILKRGQVLLVQLTKEARGNKGASFTTYLSLAGKYCVLMPNKSGHYGISRKISNTNERKRLKNIVAGLAEYTKTASIIARTAAAGHTTLEIKKDYEYLAKLWNQIREVSLKAKVPCFIHQEEDIIQKVIRDMCDRYVSEILIQGERAYKKAADFVKEISPSDNHKIKEYKNHVPIFTKFAIEEQLMRLYQPIVNLESGGYIVINPTEALISIDVNSGKSTSERNIEDTALKTNLEAAKEITRQVKLRELSGLIVIDFIDMQEARNRKIVERSFKEFLSSDKAKIQISPISNFGLLEMSRQRMGSSFLETNSSICLHCNGKGLIRVEESNSMLILRTIENEINADTNEINAVNIYATNGAVLHLLNNKRAEIALIEEKYNLKLNFYIDQIATADSYSLEKIKCPIATNRIDQQFKEIETNELEVKEVKSKASHKRRGKHKIQREVIDNTLPAQQEFVTSASNNNNVKQSSINKDNASNDLSSLPAIISSEITESQLMNIASKNDIQPIQEAKNPITTQESDPIIKVSSIKNARDSKRKYINRKRDKKQVGNDILNPSNNNPAKKEKSVEV